METKEQITEMDTLLDTNQRCDGCGQQANVSVLLPSQGTALLFCRHHYTKNETALVNTGAVVVKFRIE